MKTLRRLAFAALFAAAVPAFAGPPATNQPASSPPASSSPNTNGTPFTPTELKAALGRYKVVEESGEGDERAFTLSGLYYQTKDKQDVSWSVSLKVYNRKGRPPVVRLMFPCQAVSGEANAERLAELLAWNGIAADTAAYFVIGGTGKNRMLSLVSEVPTAGLTGDTIRDEVEGLFKAAEVTMFLWGNDLTKPFEKKGK